jgi:putative transposase
VIDALIDAGFSVKVCCKVLGVSRQGYYRYRRLPMSATMMRREWLTALIAQVHAESRGTYGSRRVRAELIQGRGIGVSERLVWRLMHDAGLQGLPGPAKARRDMGIPTSDVLVERRFAQSRLNELWVSGIAEHTTREGKVYCYCIMDTCSRRIVGWSIDTVQDSQLVINALDMAISQRTVRTRGIVHADHGVQSVHLVGMQRENPERRAHALLRISR